MPYNNFVPGESPERWLPIDGWPGYDVSDWGRVRSWWGSGGQSKGRRGITNRSKLIGGYQFKSGHLNAILYRNDSTEKRLFGHHVLVLEAFVCPRPGKMEACHFNGNPADNRLSNLRWDTRGSNQIDTLRHGTHRHAKLREGDISSIWRRVLSGETNVAIASDFGISDGIIAQIKSGAIWSHVTSTLEGWPLVRDTDAEGKSPIFIPDRYCGDEEFWEVIPAFPAYRASTHGRIQSRWTSAKGQGRGKREMGPDWLDRKTNQNPDGYLCFSANGPTGVRCLYVHQIVLSLFATPKPTGYVGCHIDGDKFNNRASNLKWDTMKANAIERERHKRDRLAQAGLIA